MWNISNSYQNNNNYKLLTNFLKKINNWTIISILYSVYIKLIQNLAIFVHLNFLQSPYKNIAQTLVNTLHGLLNCEIGVLYWSYRANMIK